MRAWRACAALVGLAVLAARAEPAADGPAARGKYLADIGDCVSCHTRAGGAPYAGGVGFDTPVGTIYSTNITPDASTGIGGWSLGQFRRAMQEGRAADGSRLFPVFPYPAFTKLTDADIDDLYAYLRSLAPVRSVPPSNGTAFALRWPMALWNSLSFSPGRFAGDAAKSPEWNRGAYLVQGLGHCGACHSPRNWMLAEKADGALTGGTLTALVAPGRNRTWSAVNLTPAKEGLAAWSVTDLAHYLRSGFSPRAGTFGPMNEVIGNSLRFLRPDDAQAIAVYLKSLPAAATETDPVAAELSKAGAPVYRARCEKCHGAAGRGGLFGGPPLAGSATVQARDPASLINIILYGQSTPPDAALGSWETMQGYADVLDDAEIAAVCNFIRGSWGNRGAAVTAARVRAQR